MMRHYFITMEKYTNKASTVMKNSSLNKNVFLINEEGHSL